VDFVAIRAKELHNHGPSFLRERTALKPQKPVVGRIRDARTRDMRIFSSRPPEPARHLLELVPLYLFNILAYAGIEDNERIIGIFGRKPPVRRKNGTDSANESAKTPRKTKGRAADAP
jgi:hypothetical protein